MKKYILQFATIISLGALLIATDSCRKLEDFGDTNLNPNGVSEPVMSALLTNIGVGLSATVTTQPPAMFCQYLAESTYPGISKYTGLQLEASGNYSGILMDCQVIINFNSDPVTAGKAAQSGDNNNQIAIATILKSYVLWTLTDRWGDLPYSQALLGAAVLLPKYDEQKDIYTGLLNDLTGAIGRLNPTGNKIAGDVVYDGNIAKWGKFANSLKMLIALRMSKRYPNAGEYAATEFNTALNNAYGYITENADNFAVKYPGGFYQNPYTALNVSQDVAVSLTFTDVLSGLGDARLSSMASSLTGCPYGLAGAAQIGIPYARTMNGVFALENSSLVIINAASVLLARAEAIERGWIPGLTTTDAKAAYDAAVAVSFNQWAQTLPSNYLTTGATNYETGAGLASMGGVSVPGSSATTTTKLQRIALQQWIAFYPAGIQGWSNWRRTGVPNLQPTIFSVNTSGEIPRRYTYGVSDYNTNAVQLNIAIGRLPNGDSQDEYVWWDRP